ASDAEKALARRTLEQVRAFLRERGWPEPVVCDSGNGYHLLYRIDLPADDGGLVERVLRALAARFDSDQVKIDQAVCNPARLCKLPGTLARKGDSTPLRPHRRPQLLGMPRTPTDQPALELVPRELLEQLAPEAPQPETKPSPAGTTPAGNGEYHSRLLVARWLGDLGVAFRVKEQP